MSKAETKNPGRSQGFHLLSERQRGRLRKETQRSWLRSSDTAGAMSCKAFVSKYPKRKTPAEARVSIFYLSVSEAGCARQKSVEEAEFS